MTATGRNIVIKWITREMDKIERIRLRFGLPSYTTLNGLTPCLVKEEDMELFNETARRGYFCIRPMK